MSRLVRIFLLIVAVLVSNQAIAKSPFSFISFKKSKSVAKSSHLLTEDNGPWMIFVSAFAGSGAEAEARQLVESLRKEFKVNAYLHRQHYDFTENVKGKGFNKYGEPKKMKYNSDMEFDEVAVLVGDFQSVTDPRLQKILKGIKYASSEQLALRGGKESPTTRRFAGIRSLQKKITKNGEKRRKGPLGNAFATRNPMIPKEAMAPKGLDPLLIEMNRRVKYSLLENPGKYTVRVASFRGQVVIDQKKIYEIQNNKRRMDGRINDTDDKAEELAAILRAKDIEAYVYHDRHESIVTVGSFAEIGSKRKDGKIELVPRVAQIIQTYGPEKTRIPGASSQYAGIQPRAITIGKGPSKKQYIFDVAPQPIVVPRRSIATDYLSSN